MSTYQWGLAGAFPVINPLVAPFKIPQQDLISYMLLPHQDSGAVPALCFMQMQSHVVEKFKKKERKKERKKGLWEIAQINSYPASRAKKAA